MPNTEPATSQDAAGQGTAQQPDVAQLILGVGVNPYAALRHQGGSRAKVAARIDDYNRRRHSALQMMSPVDYEQALQGGEAA
jgi:hypothetical protein